jgi:hypothetical protein
MIIYIASCRFVLDVERTGRQLTRPAMDFKELSLPITNKFSTLKRLKLYRKVTLIGKMMWSCAN